MIFLQQTNSAKVFHNAGMDIDNILNSLQLAALGGEDDHKVSESALLQVLGSLNDEAQKKDVWATEVRVRNLAEHVTRMELGLQEGQSQLRAELGRQGALMEGIARQLNIASAAPPHTREASGAHQKEVGSGPLEPPRHPLSPLDPLRHPLSPSSKLDRAPVSQPGLLPVVQPLKASEAPAKQVTVAQG